MNNKTIIIKRTDFEKLLKTIDRQMTSFYLERMPANKKDGECRCSIASELVAFHVREAVMQVTRSFCRIAGQEFPIPALLKGQRFKILDPSPKQEGDQT